MTRTRTCICGQTKTNKSYAIPGLKRPRNRNFSFSHKWPNMSNSSPCLSSIGLVRNYSNAYAYFSCGQSSHTSYSGHRLNETLTHSCLFKTSKSSSCCINARSITGNRRPRLRRVTNDIRKRPSLVCGIGICDKTLQNKSRFASKTACHFHSNLSTSFDIGW